MFKRIHVNDKITINRGSPNNMFEHTHIMRVSHKVKILCNCFIVHLKMENVNKYLRHICHLN